VPMVCNQRLVLIASRYVHRTVNSDCLVPPLRMETLLAVLCANYVPPVSQLCANVWSQRLVLTASCYVHQTVNSDCSMPPLRMETLLAVLCTNCVPPVSQLCANGVPADSPSSRSSEFCSWAPLVLSLGPISSFYVFI
jgi:hypothetical protein